MASHQEIPSQQENPPLDLDVPAQTDSFFEKQLTRRELLDKYGRIVSAAGLVAYGGLVGSLVHDTLDTFQEALDARPERPTSVTFVGEVPYKFQSSVAFLFPGLGEPNADKKALTWKDRGGVPPHVPVAGIDYGSEGFENITELADVIRKSIHTPSTKELYTCGNSTGGLFEVALAVELGIPVRRTALSSAPSSFDEARYPNLSAALTRLPEEDLLEAAVLYGIRFNDTEGPLDERLVTAAEKVRDGTQSQSGFAALNRAAHKIDLTDEEFVADAKKVFRPDFSEVIYIRNKPSFDGWVDLDDSFKRYEDFFAGCDVSCMPLVTDYDGHAHLDPATQALGKEIERREVIRLMGGED